MIDYVALQKFVYSECLYDSHIHGLKHWRQVEFNGILMAPINGADVDVVRLFSIFHDSKRIDDGYDEEHGQRGADFAKWCLDKKMFELEKERFDLLYHAS